VNRTPAKGFEVPSLVTPIQTDSSDEGGVARGPQDRASWMREKSKKFFATQTDQSRVKAEIITKYFASRVVVMKSTA
jgi:hypothetical protein